MIDRLARIVPVRSSIDIPYDVQVVVVDVDDFDLFLIRKGVRIRPALSLDLAVVDRALVVCMVQLSGADERVEARWIDIVGDQRLHDANVVTLRFVEEWNSTFDR